MIHDVLAPIPTEAVSREFSRDGRAVILNADVDSALADLPPASFRLIITSPPYNIGKRYEKQVALNDYLQTQRGAIRRLVTLLAPNGSLCWQVGNYVDDGEVFPLDIYFYPIFKEL